MVVLSIERRITDLRSASNALFEIAVDLHKAFGRLPPRSRRAQEIMDIERRHRHQLDRLCLHLAAMASGELRRHWYLCKDTDPKHEQSQISQRAIQAVSILFERLSGYELFPVIRLIDGLFDNNKNAGPDDVFRYLHAAVRISVRQFIKRLARENYGPIAHVFTAVNESIARSERCERYGDLVYSGRRETVSEVKIFGYDEIMTQYAYANIIPKTVSEAVDVILDLLGNTFTGKNLAVRAGTLRRCTFEMLRHRLVPDNPRGLNTTLQRIIEERFGETRLNIIADIDRLFRWGRLHSATVRTAFIEAGKDILFDLAWKGSRTVSLFRYLSCHLDGCTGIYYKRFYKGSFQHFVKKIEETWKKESYKIYKSIHYRGV